MSKLSDFLISLWLIHWYLAAWSWWVWRWESAISFFFGGSILAMAGFLIEDNDMKAERIAMKKFQKMKERRENGRR